MRRFGIEVAAEERAEIESLLRRQLVVRDQEDFITSFDPREGDTLQRAVDDLVDHFHAPDGSGYAESDMVIWRDGRIMAVVRLGDDGEPRATLFPEPAS